MGKSGKQDGPHVRRRKLIDKSNQGSIAMSHKHPDRSTGFIVTEIQACGGKSNEKGRLMGRPFRRSLIEKASQLSAA